MTELKPAGTIRFSPRWTAARPCCDNHGHLVSKHDKGPNLRRGIWLALALGRACRERAQGPAEWPLTPPPPSPCHIDAPSACRVGCDADPLRKVPAKAYKMNDGKAR